ncbi:tetratricopeptide repeat protein [Marinoscillum sp.]|uniref:tetratricopeptide repeat protein n=1 Tax=Marinoscillum sp. TaxID=2024838 RepID=UPI003BA8E740
MKTLAILLMLSCFTGVAQDLKQTADANYQNQQWADAEKDYKKYVKKNSADSSAWYRLAFCQMKLGDYEASLVNFDKALETNFYPGYTLYNKSKVYALQGNTEKMYETLSTAAQQGFNNFGQLQNEDEWKTFREQERFVAALQRVKENAFPCLADPVRRHFDFWIGEWDVMVNGRKVGENNITLAEGGCALHESYTTPGNFSGQSINYYNPLDKKWHQTWVASGGNVLDYTEVDKEEGMIQFVADFLNPAGQVVKSRLTFTANEDGSVRQLFENSSDGGETWTAGFDGLYVKRKEN